MTRQIFKSILAGCLSLAFALTAKAEPITLAITDADEFARWTVIDANHDGTPYRWEYNSGGYALYTQNKSGASDDWLISPAIHLDGGKSYKVTFKYRNASAFSSDKQKLKIFIGDAPEIGALTTELFKNESVTKTTWAVDGVCTKYFSPATSGDYYLACYSYSASYMGDTEFYSFTVDEIVSHPGAVTALSVTAAPEGEMKATLTWTWPSVTDLGGTLTGAITGAKVYRGTTSSFTVNESSLVGTAEGGEPGATGTWVDTTVPSGGQYYYKVVPFDGNGASTATPTSVQSPWIGPDTSLGSIKSVTATVDPDNERTVFVNFEAPAGSHGAYVDPTAIHYKIVRKNGAGTSVTLEDDYSGELPYVDSTIPGLDKYTYTVYTIYNGSTSWSGTTSNAVTTGGTVALPYTQDFSSTTSTDLYTFFHGPDATRDWSRSSSSLGYWGNPADAWACTPKFSLEAGKAYQLSFTARVSRATSPKDLYVYYGPATTAEALQPNQVFYETISNTIATTKTVTISVPATGDYCLAFRCYGPSDSYDLYVDDIVFKEVEIIPAAVSDFTATAAEKGQLKVNLQWTNPTLTNAGTELASIGSVDIYNGTEKVATAEGQTPGQTGTCTVEVATPGVYTFKAVVTQGDNSSEAAEATTGWVGVDTPKAPVSVTVDNTTAGRVITFEPPTESVNGGYVDYDALKYTVYRNNEPIAENVGTEGYTDTDKLQLGKYTYGVAATGGEQTKADPIILGDAYNLLAAPYNPDFSDPEHFELWTQVDENGNPVTNWKQGTNQNKQNSWSMTSGTAGWTFTPPFVAYIGTIDVTFAASAYSWRWPEDVDVYLCTSTNPADIDNFKKLGSFNIDSTIADKHEIKNVEIDDHGTYYIGYHIAERNFYFHLNQSDVAQTLTTTGIESVGADRGGIAYNAASGLISAPQGWNLQVVGLTGVIVARGVGRADVSAVAPGIYIVAATDLDGKTHSVKLTIK